MMESQFFHAKKESLESMQQAVLLALEIAAVVTGNFPAAFAVMAIHTLIFAYQHRELAAQVFNAAESKLEHNKSA